VHREPGPPEVQAFSISHGLNYLTAQHEWLCPHWRFFAAAGIAIAHRENTVRGRRLDETGGLFDAGYELTGPVLGLGAATTIELPGPVQLRLEARILRSWVEVDVVEGRARTSNLALHLLVGPRLGFGAGGRGQPGAGEAR